MHVRRVRRQGRGAAGNCHRFDLVEQHDRRPPVVGEQRHVLAEQLEDALLGLAMLCAPAPADTPGVVEVHLRADPKLDPRTAQALAEGFRIMYERFTQDEPERPVPRDARRG
jgi:hypothetical protein